MVLLGILPCGDSLIETSDDAVDFGRGLTKDACFLMERCVLISAEASSK